MREIGAKLVVPGDREKTGVADCFVCLLPLNSHVEILILNVIMLGRWGLREAVRS